MCCIVKSNHASLIAVHWQTPYSAFKFLFPPPPPTPSWHQFFPVQANWCFLLLGVECWASFNQSHFRHFYAVFLLICTQTVLSHDMKILNNYTQWLFMGKPPFILFFFLAFFFLFNLPSKISTEWAQIVGCTTSILLVQLY